MLPSVSVIMPVGYGDRFFKVALNCFLNQTYDVQLEIVVVDNSDEPIKALLSTDERIKYHRCERMTVGALRNYGTNLATGTICISGDEDDWSHPDRVAEQVRRLQETGRAVTGFHNILFFNMEDDTTWKYFYEHNYARMHPPYACGTSQMYLKSWWETHPYQDIDLAEDYWFQKAALDAGQLDSIDAGHLCVARAHRGSQSYPQFGHAQFPSVPRESFPQGFWEAIGK